jgi:prevent-host-death family protein
MASTIPVRELNQNTSAVLHRVEDGEEFVVTRAGKPQARIIPFRPRDRWEQLVAEGRIIPAETTAFRPLTVIDAPFIDIDAILAEERADRDLP